MGRLPQARGGVRVFQRTPKQLREHHHSWLLSGSEDNLQHVQAQGAHLDVVIDISDEVAI